MLKTRLALSTLFAGIVALAPLAGANTPAPGEAPQIKGYYVEARSCDVYTGPCVANGEIGLTGEEALLSWTVSEGAWEGVDLAGLSVIAAVKASATLGSTYDDPYPADAVVIVDEQASDVQRVALLAMAQELGGELIGNVTKTLTAPIEAAVGQCANNGCSIVKAEGLVELDTRCLKSDDHLCGNEVPFYPPLTKVDGAMPAYTEVASYLGEGLGLTWNEGGRRSAFLATFSH